MDVAGKRLNRVGQGGVVGKDRHLIASPDRRIASRRADFLAAFERDDETAVRK